MDLSKSIEPRSDQQNYEDYLSGPKTVKISGVTQGNAEQPVNIELEEYPGRPFKPSKTVRRVLVSAWGADSSVYIGRRMTLFGDPAVKWADEAVGGIRVSHLSDIDKPLTIALSVSRGKRQKVTIQPLKEAPEPAASTTGEIPPEVTANATKAKADGALDQYVAWLTEQGAPEHIIEYARSI